MHRPLPEGANLKQVLVTKKADGWYISLVLSNETVPESTPETIIPTWENSLGLDAVLHEDTYLATSEGEKLPSLKPLRRNEAKKAVLQPRRTAASKVLADVESWQNGKHGSVYGLHGAARISSTKLPMRSGGLVRKYSFMKNSTCKG